MEEIIYLDTLSWFKMAWKTYIGNFKKIIISTLIITIIPTINILINPFYSQMSKNTNDVIDIIFFFSNILLLPLTIGCFYLFLKMVRHEHIKILNIFDGFRYFGTTLINGILLGEIINPILFIYFFFAFSPLGEGELGVGSSNLAMIGCIPFFIYSIVLYLKYKLSSFAILDKLMGISKSLSFSGKITFRYKNKLFFILLVEILSNLLQVPILKNFDNISPNFKILSLLIGIFSYLIYIFVFFPLVNISFAVAYHNLTKIYD